MFASLKNFLCRHRRKLVISSFVVGGAIFAVNYAHRKVLEWQENEAKEFLKKTKKEKHYRSTERTCNQTIFSLSKTLKETIFKILDSDEILRKIREGDECRIALWEELKVIVFAQICSLLYGGLMLVLLLRIQLNIVGAYMVRDDYLESQSTTSQEEYLSLCQHFLEKSVHDLCIVMKKHSELILKDISLKKKLTLQDIENIFWRLGSSLDEKGTNPLKNLPSYLIPGNNGNKGEVDDFFKNVVLETVDILRHPEIVSVAESSLNRAFSNTVDKIADYYVVSDKPRKNGCVEEKEEPPCQVVNVTNLTVPLAKVVPILHGLYKSPLENGSPDPWIQQFVTMEQLSSLGANTYEAYSSDDI